MSLESRGDVSASRVARARRLLTFAVPPLVVVLFLWLGRFASSAAAPPEPPHAVAEAGGETLPSTSVSTPVQGSLILDASGSDALPRPAVELLSDGGVIVDLNLASMDDLRKLPGVGPTRAKAILDLRARLGRIKSVDDLARIKGFGRATLRRLRPMVRVGP